MKQKLIAVFAVLAMFAGLLVIGASQASAREADDDQMMGPGNLMMPTVIMGTNAGEMGKKMGQMMGKMGDMGKGMGEMMDDVKTGQPSFGIKPSGEVIVQHAKVTASSGSSLTVTVLGFSIPLTLDASLTGTSTVSVAAGDTVSARGTIDQATGVITAKVIRKDADQKAVETIKAQIQALMEQLRKLTGGKVSF